MLITALYLAAQKGELKCPPKEDRHTQRGPSAQGAPCSHKQERSLATHSTWTDPDHTMLSETPDTAVHTVCGPISVTRPQQ